MPIVLLLLVVVIALALYLDRGVSDRIKERIAILRQIILPDRL